MDEVTVVDKARQFVRSIPNLNIPVSLECYLDKVKANLQSLDLPRGQSGYSGLINGKMHIVVNDNERPERQRFTVCHEVAHIHLGLPTNHAGKSDNGIYTKRPPNEVYCDVFAAELLLPSDYFKPRASEVEISFSMLEKLAGEFSASLTATGSRFAFLNKSLCAFVLAEQGIVRYASRSLPLRDLNAWVQIGYKVPPSSLAAKGKTLTSHDRCAVDPTEWFEDWDRYGTLLEETRYFHEWDQTLSLLWFEEDYLPAKGGDVAEADEDTDPYCRELDGNLPWTRL